ncbi:carboxy-terminal processing protease CtpB [Clostridiales bacterium]|nr:carboxy-terminal processing protease CtpB [Clostridiales bacterium]
MEANAVDKKIKCLKIAVTALAIVLVAVLAILAAFIYSNYDYFLFKTIMTRGYVYEDSLQRVIDDELDQNESDIGKYFDYAVINTFTHRLYEESGDRYTHLYLPVQYTARIEQEQELGNSCAWYEFTKDTAYLSITNFTKESLDFVKESSADMAEYDNLILDLRGNPGGYVSSASSIADMFLGKGETISVEKSSLFFLSKKNSSKEEPVFNFDKIIVLQDKNTASSSEILIGALRDNLSNVVLLGETTYGKGIGQCTVPLKNGFYYIATMFTWETPNGDVIHGKGIAPDKEFTLETLAAELGININTEAGKED